MAPSKSTKRGGKASSDKAPAAKTPATRGRGGAKGGKLPSRKTGDGSPATRPVVEEQPIELSDAMSSPLAQQNPGFPDRPYTAADMETLRQESQNVYQGEAERQVLAAEAETSAMRKELADLKASMQARLEAAEPFKPRPSFFNLGGSSASRDEPRKLFEPDGADEPVKAPFGPLGSGGPPANQKRRPTGPPGPAPEPKRRVQPDGTPTPRPQPLPATSASRRRPAAPVQYCMRCAWHLANKDPATVCDGVFKGALSKKCGRCNKQKDACRSVTDAQLRPLVRSVVSAFEAHTSAVGAAASARSQAALESAQAALSVALRQHASNSAKVVGTTHVASRAAVGSSSGDALTRLVVFELQRISQALIAQVELGRLDAEAKGHDLTVFDGLWKLGSAEEEHAEGVVAAGGGEEEAAPVGGGEEHGDDDDYYGSLGEDMLDAEVDVTG